MREVIPAIYFKGKTLEKFIIGRGIALRLFTMQQKKALKGGAFI